MKIEYKNLLWYKKPHALTLIDWAEWENAVKKAHPIQYSIREKTSDFYGCLRHSYNRCRRFIKKIVKPYNVKIRKAIPREWADVTSLIVQVNFAMIEQFYDEAQDSHVDWEFTEESAKFKKWLEGAHLWITKERKELEVQLENSYPEVNLMAKPEIPWIELYGEVVRLEELINKRDSEILKEAIDYRDYMWT